MSQLDTPKSGDILVDLTTDHGEITIKLFPEEAPKTSENFRLLCERGYYDTVIFHRVIENFMIQGGDPTGRGNGGESAFGGEFDNEISPALSHIVGAVSMANAGPDTNGSQFFIVQGKPAKFLDGDYSIFGQVISGQEVVDTIAKLRTGRDDRPIQPPKILSTKIRTIA